MAITTLLFINFLGNNLYADPGPAAADTQTKKILTQQITQREVTIERQTQEIVSLQHRLAKAQSDVEKAGLQPSNGRLRGWQPPKDTSAEIVKLKKRDGLLSSQNKRLRMGLQLSARELLRLRFGDGPYQVRLIVEFPASMGSPREGEFVLELASAMEVPVAAYYFLAQVSAGLWNGCSFHRNADHVLQAGTISKGGRSMHSAFKRRSDVWESIPFQEYSENVPHKKYTIGLAGRPGGPDWYISTLDNTRNHGPGGQGAYDLPAEADPCFGRVVGGVAVVDRMHTAPKKPGDRYEGLVENIFISRAEII